MSEQPPKLNFHVKKFADVGANEEFVKRTLELHDILGATSIFGAEREQVSGSLTAFLTEGLMPAFMELREIRDSTGKDLPILDNLQMYEAFYGKLWKAYKEYMKNAARVMGFEIGFLFQREKQFEDGLKAFREKNPSAPTSLEEYLCNVRRLWHTDLANFRNTVIEHPGADRSQFQKFYRPQFPEALFVEVWHTSNEILAMLLEFKLPAGVYVEWLPWDKPDPQWPTRYRWQLGTMAPKS